MRKPGASTEQSKPRELFRVFVNQPAVTSKKSINNVEASQRQLCAQKRKRKKSMELGLHHGGARAEQAAAAASN